MYKKMTVIDFLKILENASGDEVLDLIHQFQLGAIHFTDIFYEIGEEM